LKKENSAPDHRNSLFTDCHLVTMGSDSSYGVIRDGALAVQNGDITWVGPKSDLPYNIFNNSKDVYNMGGRWMTPGLIDCHTHLVYAGNRASEFEMRLNGATYEEIARKGGGILSTVKAVRNCSEEALYNESLPRLKGLMAEGVTTVEIKSGYGLSTEPEIKMLKVANRLGHDFPVTVHPTFLGAHALPPEYVGRPDNYIDLVVDEMLPAIAKNGLAESVDVFCESIGFNLNQTERVFQAAKAHGLKIKLHGEQLSDQKGAILAARYGALSVDHLEYLSRDGVEAMAKAGTVATLLPGAFYFLHETTKPPVELLRDASIPIALSTDCNPGSSPSTSPLLMMNMACVLFGLTPLESLAGFTVNAAKALGIETDRGSLEVGKKGDLAVWDIDEPAELAYRIGGNPCKNVIKAGKLLEMF
jgi:imidazolonepropionase